MRIFFDDEIFHWEKRGGVTRYICEVATILSRDYATPVTVFGGWSPSLTLRELKRSSQLAVIHRPRDTRLRINSWAKRISGVWRRREFRKLRSGGEDEIVYHPSLYSYDEAIAREASALVLTIHDMQLEVFNAQTTHSRKHLPLKHRAIRAADWIFCISKHTEADLHRFVPESRGKTQVVYNDSTLQPIATGETLPGDPCEGRPYFMVVGTRKGYKNGRAVMEAFAAVSGRHAELRLLLCGARPPGSDGELDFPGGEALRNRIVWTTPNDRELAASYARALGLIYPSSYEGFGLPVVEAMRCGCPVVTTTFSSLPEVGGDAAVYLESPTALHIERAMEGLVTDGAQRERLRGAGRLQAAKFSWHASVGQMLDGYRTAIARRRQSHDARR
jgi:glycosyltransferase involved in cell wall biosynthesis